MTKQSFYAVEYPASFDKENPVYPYTIVVYRFGTWQGRNHKVTVERMKNYDNPPRWFRLETGDKRIGLARALAERGHHWPIRLRIESPIESTK